MKQIIAFTQSESYTTLALTRPELVEGFALIGFVFSPLKIAKFLVFTCNKRAYTNLGLIQIGFVLHFLVDL